MYLYLTRKARRREEQSCSRQEELQRSRTSDGCRDKTRDELSDTHLPPGAVQTNTATSSRLRRRLNSPANIKDTATYSPQTHTSSPLRHISLQAMAPLQTSPRSLLAEECIKTTVLLLRRLVKGLSCLLLCVFRTMPRTYNKDLELDACPVDPDTPYEPPAHISDRVCSSIGQIKIQVLKTTNVNVTVERSSQGITNVIKIHPLETISVYTKLYGNPSKCVEIFQSRPKWYDFSGLKKELKACVALLPLSKVPPSGADENTRITTVYHGGLYPPQVKTAPQSLSSSALSAVA
ncbi:hypothetical protein EYF80_001185 [Liparis tanakae]|uniref:Uncharacterized protein n=1 Tax=Liparis tanakae TaxID=230148 RepID=A0A4Z2JF47_9TELE|nr:hypothetical protein EYF80_001185 [Liparis tanakae]